MSEPEYYCDFAFSSLVTRVSDNPIFACGYSWARLENGLWGMKGDMAEIIHEGRTVYFTFYDTMGDRSVITSFEGATLDFGAGTSPFVGFTSAKRIETSDFNQPPGVQTSRACNVEGKAWIAVAPPPMQPPQPFTVADVQNPGSVYSFTVTFRVEVEGQIIEFRLDPQMIVGEGNTV